MYVKFHPGEFVLRYHNGRLVKQGRGLSFHCMARSTSVCVVPLTGIDADFMFSQVTRDFQTVSVQGQLSYRFTDCLASSPPASFASSGAISARSIFRSFYGSSV